MTDWGMAFERYVSELYREYKKAVVKHDVLEFAHARSGRVRAQFDFLYKNRLIPYIGIADNIPTIGPWHYAECKFRSKERGSRVTFDEVTTFAGKLELIGIPRRRGEFITNVWYEKRAIAFAQDTDITMVDRDALVRMDYFRTLLKQGYPPLMPYRVFDRKLEERIRSYA